MTGKDKLSFEDFCERLKSDGAYIGDDWHVYLKNGKPVSRQCRNKYYMVRKRYNGIEHNFMEHRVIWYWLNGSIPDGLQINHKDFDRTNNRIDNLELMTAKENLRYSLDAGRGNPTRAEKSGKAIYSNKDAQAMRWLKKHGWSYSEITKLFSGNNEYCIGRIIRGVRYGSVPDTEDVKDIYSTVIRHAKSDISVEDVIHSLERDINELLLIDKIDERLSKVGDIVGNIVFLGEDAGIDMTELLKETEARV